MTDLDDHIDGADPRLKVHPDSAARAVSEHIANGIAAGDTRALGKLYDLMGRRAFGLAYTVTRDPMLAEDAVQDAFLSLWRQARSVSNRKGKIESLLMTLVHRRAVDHVRSRSRSDRVSKAVEMESRTAGAGDPEQQAVDSTERQAVLRALESLPEEQKDAIELAYFRGLTQREIADETGVSLGTVKGRIRLGLEKLRHAFEPYGERS